MLKVAIGQIIFDSLYQLQPRPCKHKADFFTNVDGFGAHYNQPLTLAKMFNYHGFYVTAAGIPVPTPSAACSRKTNFIGYINLL